MDNPEKEKTIDFFKLPKAERDARLERVMKGADERTAGILLMFKCLSDIQDELQGDLPPDAIL